MNKNLLALLMIVLAGLMYPFFVRPLMERGGVIREENASLQKNIEDAQKFVEEFDSLRSRATEFDQEEKERLNRLVPNEVNPVQLALDLERMAAGHDLELDGSIGVKGAGGNETNRQRRARGDQEEEKEFREVRVGLSLSGSYANFTEFLSTLSESLQLIDVESISFTGQPAVPNTKIYRYSLTLKTYELKKAQSADGD